MIPGADSIHARLGGDEPFWRIARAFYARVDRDARLRAMFPDDLEEPIRNQAEFLIQYFGGPQAYSLRKGHPRLRMRHAPFPIDAEARDRWLGHMRDAVDELDPPEEIRGPLTEYLAMAAESMRNRV